MQNDFGLSPDPAVEEYDTLVVGAGVNGASVAKELVEKIRSFDDVGIVLHDSPDPDAISSGLALEQICAEEDVDVDILYSDQINHQENKAMVNKLDLELLKVDVDRYMGDEEEFYELEINGEEFNLNDYDGVALLDTALTNTKIMEPYLDEIEPDIIVDHHSGWEGYDGDAFFDVRTERGAVASMMADYFKMLDIEPTETVSTALVHGILSDTLNLDPSSHQFTIGDINNLAFLYRFSDSSSLGEIKESSISFETAKILSSAIDHSKQDGTKLYSYVGKVGDTDAIPQAADYLVKLAGVNTVFTYGIQEGDSEKIRVSARNNDIKINIGKQLENIFENTNMPGTYGCSAGGSSTKGGASLPIEALGMMSKPIIEDQDLKKFRPAIETTIESYLSKVGSS